MAKLFHSLEDVVSKLEQLAGEQSPSRENPTSDRFVQQGATANPTNSNWAGEIPPPDAPSGA